MSKLTEMYFMEFVMWDGENDQMLDLVYPVNSSNQLYFYVNS